MDAGQLSVISGMRKYDVVRQKKYDATGFWVDHHFFLNQDTVE